MLAPPDELLEFSSHVKSYYLLKKFAPWMLYKRPSDDLFDPNRKKKYNWLCIIKNCSLISCSLKIHCLNRKVDIHDAKARKSHKHNALVKQHIYRTITSCCPYCENTYLHKYDKILQMLLITLLIHQIKSHDFYFS